MKIGFVGAGYVGLVSAALFAEQNNQILCIDKDKEKIEQLQKSKIPFYEPGLDGIVRSMLANGRLIFSNSMDDLAAFRPESVFVCVGTPSSKDGAADTNMVMDVISHLCNIISNTCVFVLKSTVPVGTYRSVRSYIDINTHSKAKFYLANNPEFLREGTAVNDFLYPDRVIIGYEEEYAKKVLEKLYRPFIKDDSSIMFMDPASSELAKYASNVYLAMKISFINNISSIASRTNADILKIAAAIGADKRIGAHFLNPGIGYGGSCLPKDTRALINTCERLGVETSLFKAIETINESRVDKVLQILQGFYGNTMNEICVSIWGGSFKPNTDDIREAPSINLIRKLLDLRVLVKVYDPRALSNLKALFLDRIIYSTDKFEAIQDSHALIVTTEWEEFKDIDFFKLKSIMRYAVLIDCRYIYKKDALRPLGIRYFAIDEESLAKNQTYLGPTVNGFE